jgi:hypothetical protein
LGETAPVPDLLIYLHAPMDVLMERIDRRGAAGEDRIPKEYLSDLIARYEKMWESWDLCPILRLDNRDMDYERDPASRDRVLALIQQALAGHIPTGSPGSTDVDREEQPSLFGPVTRRSRVENHRVGPSQEEGR